MYYSSPSDNVRGENRKSSYSKVFSSLNSIFPDEKKSYYKDPFMSDYEGENFKKGIVLFNVFVFRKYFRNEESGRLGGSPGDRHGAGHHLPESVPHRQPLLLSVEAVISVRGVSQPRVSRPGWRQRGGRQACEQRRDGGRGQSQDRHSLRLRLRLCRRCQKKWRSCNKREKT